MTDATTQLDHCLAASRGAVVAAVTDHLCAAGASPYASLETHEAARRIDVLYQEVIDAVTSRSVTSMVAYAERLADERFADGYDLASVQTAFNLLTDELWLAVVDHLPTSGHASSLALITTILGAGKDAVACRYAALAAQDPAPDLDALFDGTDTACLAR